MLQERREPGLEQQEPGLERIQWEPALELERRVLQVQVPELVRARRALSSLGREREQRGLAQEPGSPRQEEPRKLALLGPEREPQPSVRQGPSFQHQPGLA